MNKDTSTKKPTPALSPSSSTMAVSSTATIYRGSINPDDFTASETLSSFSPSPSFPPEEKQAEYIPYLPLDKGKYKQYEEAFSRRITAPLFTKGETKDEEGNKLITYTTQTRGGELKYSFYEHIIKKELGQEATQKLPTLGRKASRLWYSLIYFAKKQGRGLEGNFTTSELMDLQGIDKDKRGGNYFEDIRQTFFNMVAVSPSFTNKRSGEERIDWGFSFLSSYLIKGEGKEARYYYTITPEALGLTEKWLKGELTIDEIKKQGGYLAYPLASLQGGLDETEQRFKDNLLRFKGGYTIRIYTILTDWLKLRKDLLRRPTYCHQLINEYLNNAKERGEVTSYKLEIKTLKDWRTGWKVTINKPTEKKAVNKWIPLELVEQDQLIEKVYKWQKRPIQGIKKTPEDLKKQIVNTVRAYGAGPIREIYERTANGSKPSTYDFWQEVKMLKSDREYFNALKGKDHKTTNQQDHKDTDKDQHYF